MFCNEFSSLNLSQNTKLILKLKDFTFNNLTRDTSGFFLINSAILCRFLDEVEQEEKEANKRNKLYNIYYQAQKKNIGK